MRPCISTISLHRLPWNEALDWAAQAGFRDLELVMFPWGLHLAPETMPAEQLVAELGRRGLRLAVVHGSDLNGNSMELLEASVAYLERLVPYIARAGAQRLNLNGMPVPAGTSLSERQVMIERIITGLRRLEPLVVRCGLSVTLENHYRCHIEQPADYLQIFRALPDAHWLGATIDTGHCQLAGVDSPELARVLGRRVMHVHIKDHCGSEAVMLGAGEIDNLALLRVLRSSGYTGWLSAEVELPDAEAQCQGAVAALTYLERLIAQSAEVAV